MFGVALSYGYHFYRDDFMRFCSHKRWLITLCGVSFLSLAFLVQESAIFMQTIGLTHCFVGAGMLLCAAIATDFPENGLTRTVSFLAARSYSIYLWHLLVGYVVLPYFERTFQIVWSYELRTLVFILVGIAVGLAMASLVEIPMLKLRSRFFPSEFHLNANSDKSHAA